MSSEPVETKTKILDAAWALLEAADGEVRMSDIAKRAGISRQAVYLHFPTRAELLIATTRHIDRVKDVDGQLDASRSTQDGPGRLSAFVAAWCGYMPQIYGVARALIHRAATDEAARAAWDDRLAAIRHGCAAAVAALEKDGLLAPEHTAQDATDLLAALVSIASYEALCLRAGWSEAHFTQKMQAAAAQLLVAPKAMRAPRRKG